MAQGDRFEWFQLQRQRIYIARDSERHNDIVAIAENKGDLHGPHGIDDPTGQRWWGYALLPQNLYTSYSELPTFSNLRACIEEDLLK